MEGKTLFINIVLKTFHSLLSNQAPLQTKNGVLLLLSLMESSTITFPSNLVPFPHTLSLFLYVLVKMEFEDYDGWGSWGSCQTNPNCP